VSVASVVHTCFDCDFVKRRRYAVERAKVLSSSAAPPSNVPSAVVLNFSTAFLPEAEDTVQTSVTCDA
jgi:hypothetical protein